MIGVHPASMLALMFLLHLIADYTLQGCLANLKQRKWWEEQIPKDMKEPDRFAMWERYKNDYQAALWCHGMYWSLVVCLPLLATGGVAYAINALIHGAIHTVIDHAKANRHSLNLVQDQLLHCIQVCLIWVEWVFNA